MKKRFKTTVAALLAVSLVVGVTGCGKKEVTEEKPQAEPENKTEGGTYTDYSNGFSERVTIEIPVFDRAFEGWDVTDNYYTNWVQKEFGDKYNVDVKFTAIARSSQVNDYMQLLASGKAPNIIFHYDMPQMLAYYDEGAMQPLDLEEIAYYAPTYWENMGEIIGKYSQIDGENYFFFAARPEAYNNVYLIRQDWLDAVNMDMPTCLEELEEVLKAWKDAGLGNGGGRLTQSFAVYNYPFRTSDISDEEWALYSDLSIAAMDWEPTHQFLKDLNYQYNQGLIDTEFYLNTDDSTTQADFIAGNSGILECYLSNNSPIISSLVANDPEAKVSYLPFAARVPKGNNSYSRAFWPFGMIMGINQDSTDEERAATWMYMEWLSNPENLFYMQNGVEGQNYTFDEDGIAVKIEGYDGESKLSNNNNKDYWCLVTESAVYENEELNHKANVKNWAPIGYEYLIEDSRKDYEATAEYRIPDALFNTNLVSVAEYKAELLEAWKELYVKCVMASEEEFETVYQEACQDYLDAGYQEILDEKKTAIEAGKYR